MINDRLVEEALMVSIERKLTAIKKLIIDMQEMIEDSRGD